MALARLEQSSSAMHVKVRLRSRRRERHRALASTRCGNKKTAYTFMTLSSFSCEVRVSSFEAISSILP